MAFVIPLTNKNMISKVHSEVSVPFKWEKQPGIPKTQEGNQQHQDSELMIPSPLMLSESLQDNKAVDIVAAATCDGLRIPLPPCSYQQPPLRRSCSSRSFGLRRQGKDPFLVAYRECTKVCGTTKGKETSDDHKWKFPMKIGAMKSFFGFSCKNTSYDGRIDTLGTASKDPK
ncbi:hypothetical protein Drorol1_Dr00005374 [Drosera rotundifolia]